MAATTTDDGSGGSSPVGALLGVVVIALIGAGAWFVARARRAS
jgi:hypothetical protein